MKPMSVGAFESRFNLRIEILLIESKIRKIDGR